MKDSEKLYYNDIWYGEVVTEDNETFEKRHVVSRKQFENSFLGRGLSIFSSWNVTPSTVQYKLKDKNENIYNVVFTTLKHSGSKDNRIRAHISPKVVMKATDDPLYLIGAYNAGDVLLFVHSEISEFVSKSSVKQNNSSFWIGDINNVKDIYDKGETFWYRKKDDFLLKGITSDRLSELDSETIIRRFFKDVKKIDKVQPAERETNDAYDVEPVKFDEDFIKTHIRDYLARNKEYRNLALKKANYTCEICGKKLTFTTKNGEQYFDGHHLIMYNMNTQSRYEKSLDIPRNIICLCPECHKKIHYASDEVVKDLLIGLFMKHRDLFDIYDIESLDEIIDDYIKHREEEL